MILSRGLRELSSLRKAWTLFLIWKEALSIGDSSEALLDTTSIRLS